ncbi:hypothetical protein FV222_07020 [Methylobacterium sp. WL103]|nr:hypothetical protein FV222_07020 [Methylobacterium sp. WL103]
MGARRCSVCRPGPRASRRSGSTTRRRGRRTRPTTRGRSPRTPTRPAARRSPACTVRCRPGRSARRYRTPSLARSACRRWRRPVAPIRPKPRLR